MRLVQGEAQALPQDTACRLAADSVIPPCLACSWTGTQAGGLLGSWGDLGDPLSGTRLQLSSRATETALHRSCGPKAWSRCMPSIESIGRVSARSGNEQDRLVSIPGHSSRASPSQTGVSTRRDEWRASKVPTRAKSCSTRGRCGRSQEKEDPRQAESRLPEDKQENKRRIWGTTEWSNRTLALWRPPMM